MNTYISMEMRHHFDVERNFLHKKHQHTRLTSVFKMSHWLIQFCIQTTQFKMKTFSHLCSTYLLFVTNFYNIFIDAEM